MIAAAIRRLRLLPVAAFFLFLRSLLLDDAEEATSSHLPSPTEAGHAEGNAVKLGPEPTWGHGSVMGVAPSSLKRNAASPL